MTRLAIAVFATAFALAAETGIREQARAEELAQRHGTAEKLLRDAARDDPDPAFLGEAALWMARQFSPFGQTPDIRRAVPWLQIAVEEFRQRRLSRQLARALHASAALMNQGTAKKSTLSEALEAARAGGDPRDLAVIEAEWGDVLRSTGDLTGAIRHIESALARLESMQEWSAAGRALALLGRAYGLHGRYAASEKALIRGEECYRKGGDTTGVMLIRGERGLLLAVSGQRKRAVENLDQVRDYVTSAPLTPAAKIRFSGITFGYLAADENQRAAELAEQIVRRSPRRAPPVVHWVRSAAYYRLGRYLDAAEAATAGINRAGSSPFQLRECFRWRALTFHKLGKHAEAAADIHEAVRLDDSLREGLVPEDEWRRAFEETRTPLAQDAVAILWDAGQQREALDAAETFRARALRDLLASRGLAKSGPPASAGALAAWATQARIPVLAYWVHPQAVYSWWVDPRGDVRGYRFPVTRARVSQLVARAGATGYKPDREAWRELSAILIQPVRTLLPPAAQTLAIVPHDDLLQLPFGALSATSGRYLAEDYVLQYAPSATLLFASAQNGPRDGKLLLVGDPVKTAWSRLPGARRELEAIQALSPGRSTLLAAERALEPHFVQAAPRAGVLHFATHAVVDSAHPFDSFLVLSNGGKLTAAEVHELDLQADLVMLSACRSGSGRVSSDGLLGLTRAFLHAGASRVIAPVWDVPDETSVLLVAEFYRQYLLGVNPGQALRGAQKKLLAELRAGRVSVQTPAGAMVLPEHPALWAGFILQGPIPVVAEATSAAGAAGH
ncbi:MAG: CHAT domain-containing protein [Bryobacteraceae bacterium]